MTFVNCFVGLPTKISACYLLDSVYNFNSMFSTSCVQMFTNSAVLSECPILRESDLLTLYYGFTDCSLYYPINACNFSILLLTFLIILYIILAILLDIHC